MSDVTDVQGVIDEMVAKKTTETWRAIETEVRNAAVAACCEHGVKGIDGLMIGAASVVDTVLRASAGNNDAKVVVNDAIAEVSRRRILTKFRRAIEGGEG